MVNIKTNYINWYTLLLIAYYYIVNNWWSMDEIITYEGVERALPSKQQQKWGSSIFRLNLCIICYKWSFQSRTSHLRCLRKRSHMQFQVTFQQRGIILSLPSFTIGICDWIDLENFINQEIKPASLPWSCAKSLLSNNHSITKGNERDRRSLSISIISNLFSSLLNLLQNNFSSNLLHPILVQADFQLYYLSFGNFGLTINKDLAIDALYVCDWDLMTFNLLGLLEVLLSLFCFTLIKIFQLVRIFKCWCIIFPSPFRAVVVFLSLSSSVCSL